MYCLSTIISNNYNNNNSNNNKKLFLRNDTGIIPKKQGSPSSGCWTFTENLMLENAMFQKKIAADLRELRDKTVLSFFMLNALFVIVVFLLQLNKDTIFINWPLGVKSNISYTNTFEVI